MTEMAMVKIDERAENTAKLMRWSHKSNYYFYYYYYYYYYYIHLTAFYSRTTWVSQHQKSRTILIKPIGIYWSKRQIAFGFVEQVF